jgi:cell division transport system ATP-binding protein
MVENKVIELVGAEVYQRENCILTDVELSIGQGEFVYIIGKVGTGKSSLIKTLTAELPLMKGMGRCAGFQLRSIKQKEIPQLRRKLGVVFQDFRLLTDRTVYQNLEFVLKATGWKNEPKLRPRIIEVLIRVWHGRQTEKDAASVERGRTAARGYCTGNPQRPDDYFSRRTHRQPRPGNFAGNSRLVYPVE